MKTKDFNEIYRKAETVDVVRNEWFNSMGWFWLNLTERQICKMWVLICKQNHRPIMSTRQMTFNIGFTIFNPFLIDGCKTKLKDILYLTP